MDEYSSFVDALDSFSISSLSSKLQFRSAAGKTFDIYKFKNLLFSVVLDSMTTNKIPKLRFHGRSLSAKDPPILDQQNECAVDGKKANLFIINWFSSSSTTTSTTPKYSG